MYWLKTLRSAGKIELQLDICMSPAALAAPGLDERRSQLVKSICDIHREDIDVCRGAAGRHLGGPRPPALPSRAAAVGVLPLPRT